MIKNDFKKKKVLVVGAGAAGIMAAIKAAERGAEVTLFEKNERLGKKLGITGKGRCNLTNDCSVKELVANMPGNGKFLFSSLSRLNSQKTQELFTNWGVPLKVERGRRVFPSSDKAADVILALRKRLEELDVKVIYNQRVTALLQADHEIIGLKTSDGVFSGQAVILAAGGSSYPTTGSTGDGYQLAQEIGHQIIPLKPALIPLQTESINKKDLQGLSLRNVSVSIATESKVLGQEFGEMLFTHFGFSGPVVLTLSRLLLNWNGSSPRYLKIDLKPALSFEQLDLRIQRDFLKFKNRAFKNSLNELLPKSLIPVIIEMSKIDPDKPVHSVTREERLYLIDLLKNLSFRISGTRPLAEAIVTAGGVSTAQIDPKTMESKLIKNLYFAGEVIDIDGFTGGYNLQAAFSTGFTAGYFAAID